MDFNLPLTHYENGSLLYLIAYFYTVLVCALIWSIWRFVKSVLSLKPKNIRYCVLKRKKKSFSYQDIIQGSDLYKIEKAQVEKRLAQHYAERRRYRNDRDKFHQLSQFEAPPKTKSKSKSKHLDSKQKKSMKKDLPQKVHADPFEVDGDEQEEVVGGEGGKDRTETSQQLINV